MPRGNISLQIENFEKLLGDINDIQNAGKVAVKNTLKDVKARAPGWIAAEVTKVYNIKKAEITPSRGKPTGKEKKMAGTISAHGDTIEDFTITYRGRLLTPVHFGMTPKAPPPGRNYTLKMQVLKGKKEVIGRYKSKRKPNGPYSKRSHNILMGTGNTQSEGTNYIPFQRMSTRRLDLKKFTTISVPQMITSERTHDAIMNKLYEETSKRLEHNLNRVIGK